MSTPHRPEQAPESPVWQPTAGTEGAPSGATAPGAPLTAIERLKQRATAAPAPTAGGPSGGFALAPAEPPGPQPLRILRNAVAGMFGPDRIVRPVVEAVVRAQRPLTTGRRVVLLGAHPGAGVTTTAVTMTLLLAQIRRERIALVGAGTDPSPIAARTGAPPRYSAEQVLAEVEAGRAIGSDQLVQVMDQIAPNAWSVAAQRDPGTPATSRLTRVFAGSFGATVVDAGSTAQGQTAALLESAHSVVLVGDGSREGMNAIEVAFSHLASAHLIQPERLVVCLVQTRRSSRIDLTWEAGVVRKQGIRSVGVPWDPHLAQGRQVRTNFLAAPTLGAHARLMAEAIDSSMTAGGRL
ncbi:MAG: hypothetical protein Q4G64_05545 [bacterium]|nr:hypothetical protein [bacterium]